MIVKVPAAANRPNSKPALDAVFVIVAAIGFAATAARVFAAELDWVVENEWVSSAEDFVWRRTRLGLRLSAWQIAAIDNYVSQRHAAITC